MELQSEYKLFSTCLLQYGGHFVQVSTFDIPGRYSLVKITFAPIGACKNNRRIRRHNANTPRSRDVTDQTMVTS